MILGRINGSCTTLRFDFLASDEVAKFAYVQVMHRDGDILAQIVEITKEGDKTLAHCGIIGFSGEAGSLRSPPTPGGEVLVASDALIRTVLRLDDSKTGALIGHLDGKDIQIHLDLNRLLQKHVAVLAKSGSGKSYAVGVLVEEIISRGVPLLIIDPHGEYHTLKYPNDDPADKERLEKSHLTPASFIREVVEFGDINIDANMRPLLLPDSFDAQELIHLLPAKLSASQQGILYSAVRDMDHIDMERLVSEISVQDGQGKWALIAIIDYLKKLGIFSASPTPLSEIIMPGRASILNLRGIEPETGEIIVAKLLSELFLARKQGKIPPFFLVVEEAHNFCPERSFGEAASSRILRTIASEGRKFGMGLCVVSQRPARLDKSVLSQCSTQIVLRVSNPGDVRAIANSVEAITLEGESGIQSLPVGVALVCGAAESPLFVRIRPRRTKHGGESASFLRDAEDGPVSMPQEDAVQVGDGAFLAQVKDFQNSPVMPLIRPKASVKDLRLMSERTIKEIKTYLIPALLVRCKDEDGEYSLLVERTKGRIITDVDSGSSIAMPRIAELSQSQLSVLLAAKRRKISAAELMVDLHIDFTRAKDTLDMLCKRGYLSVEQGTGKYGIAQDLALPLALARTFAKIEYAPASFDLKLEPLIDAKDIKDTLGRLTSVADADECFVVWHEVIYDDQEGKAHV